MFKNNDFKTVTKKRDYKNLNRNIEESNYKNEKKKLKKIITIIFKKKIIKMFLKKFLIRKNVNAYRKNT